MSKEKLTDEQIALDLLQYAYNINSERVELQKSEYTALLNLINRLKEENAELKAENERLSRTLENKMDTLAKLLEYERKETAEKFANFIKSKLFDLGNIVNERDVNDMLKEFFNENKRKKRT